MVMSFKEWKRLRLDARKEKDEKQERGFGDFGCVKCEMSILLTSGEKKKNKKNTECVSLVFKGEV